MAYLSLGASDIPARNTLSIHIENCDLKVGDTFSMNMGTYEVIEVKENNDYVARRILEAERQYKLIGTSQWCEEPTEYEFSFNLRDYNPLKPSCSIDAIFEYSKKLFPDGSRFCLFDGLVWVKALSQTEAEQKVAHILGELNDMNIDFKVIDAMSWGDIRRLGIRYA